MTKITAVSLHLIGEISAVTPKQAKNGSKYFEIAIEHIIEEGQYPKKTTYKAYVFGDRETPDVCTYEVGDLIDVTAKNIMTKNEKSGDKYETFIDLGFKSIDKLMIKVLEKSKHSVPSNDMRLESDNIPF